MTFRCCLCAVIAGWFACLQATSAVPEEPIQIGFEPQFVFDNWSSITTGPFATSDRR